MDKSYTDDWPERVAYSVIFEAKDKLDWVTACLSDEPRQATAEVHLRNAIKEIEKAVAALKNG